jgi:hypothetical protein
MTNTRGEEYQSNEGKEKNNLSSSVYHLYLFIFLRSLPNVLRTTHVYVCTTFSDKGKYCTVDNVMNEDPFVIRAISISDEAESPATV